MGSSMTWRLLRNAESRVQPRPTEPEPGHPFTYSSSGGLSLGASWTLDGDFLLDVAWTTASLSVVSTPQSASHLVRSAQPSPRLQVWLLLWSPRAEFSPLPQETSAAGEGDLFHVCFLWHHARHLRYDNKQKTDMVPALLKFSGLWD